MPVTVSTKTPRPSPVHIKFKKKKKRLANDKRKRCSKVPCLPDASQCPDALVEPPRFFRSRICCGFREVPVQGQMGCYKCIEESLGFRDWKKKAGSAQLDV